MKNRTLVLTRVEFEQNRKSIQADTALWLWRRQESTPRVALQTGLKKLAEECVEKGSRDLSD